MPGIHRDTINSTNGPAHTKMNKKFLAFSLPFVLAACAAPSANNVAVTTRTTNGIAVIIAKPKKTVCAASVFPLAGNSTRGELCITQGNFASDRYVLKLNNTTVVQGIDDETTPGIPASYQGQRITLQCAPQHIRGDASAEEVRKIVPAYSDAKVNKTVELMQGAIMPIEVGRMCSLTSGADSLMKVQVFFE
jgi:hypothetical protein